MNDTYTGSAKEGWGLVWMHKTLKCIVNIKGIVAIYDVSPMII